MRSAGMLEMHSRHVYMHAMNVSFDLNLLLIFDAVMRGGHSAARRKLNASALAALRHLEISPSGDDIGFIDAWLARHGLKRDIAHRAPYLAAARILSRSDLVAIFSLRIAEAFARDHDLRIRELPCPSPPLILSMFWHRRFENQPAHRWLRGLVETVCKS
jgi:DNA-binding transcriptional LysR family regulator